MELKLPNITIFKLEEDGSKFWWRDYYGAIETCVTYCKLLKKKRLIGFNWYHGVMDPRLNDDINYLTYSRFDKNSIYFVINNSQLNALKKNGFKKVFAIGLPIIYLNSSKTQRVINSVLVMPTHTLVGAKVHNINVFRNYIIHCLEKFSSLENKILFCLHYNDIENGFWIKELAEFGIEYIVGAKNDDSNALLRQSILFSTFDLLYTNGFGSHVAYALFYGCRVSIVEYNFNIEVYNDSLTDSMKENIKYNKIPRISELTDFNFLFVEPKDAILNVDFGKELVGYQYKVSPFKMRLLFGWSLLGKIYWRIIFMKDLLRIRTRLRKVIKN